MNLKLPEDYEISKKNSRKLKRFVDSRGVLAFSDFVNTSEVSLKVDLPMGNYLLIPCTDTEDISLEFMVRFFSEEKILLK